jgi:hypothetical protein
MIMAFSVSKDGDIELLNRDFDVVEDIPTALEDFIFLSRLGVLEEAHQLFEDKLKPYWKLFPVLVEFADMLLEEHRYQELYNLLQDLSIETDFSGNERQLLTLMKALSEVYIELETNKAKEHLESKRPKLKDALHLAQDWHRGRVKEPCSFSGLEARSFLLYFPLTYSYG